MRTKRKREIQRYNVDLYLSTKLTIQPQDATIRMQNIIIRLHPIAKLSRTIT